MKHSPLALSLQNSKNIPGLLQCKATQAPGAVPLARSVAGYGDWAQPRARPSFPTLPSSLLFALLATAAHPGHALGILLIAR